MRRGRDVRNWGLRRRSRVSVYIFENTGKGLEMRGGFRGGEVSPLHVRTDGRRQET